jgi:predicted amidophosphoribosyltransferase
MWLPKPFQVDIAAGTTLPIQAATYYDYPIRQAIRAFKHHEDMTKLPVLLHALRQLPRPHGCHHDNSVIVAMPTTNQRLIKRGFDPVSILSAQLSKHWQIPLWQGVQRIDNTSSQQGLSRAERLTNLDNAFALTEPPPVKRLLLFDDVATTGASLQALARAIPTQPMIQSASSNQTTATTPATPYHLSAYALAHGSHS